MPEQDQPKSFEERIAVCPIHQWADIDDYLERSHVPQGFRRPFHELVLARGEFPKNMSDEQGKEFGKRAKDITIYHEIQPRDAHALRIIFGQLVGQWLAEEAKNN